MTVDLAEIAAGLPMAASFAIAGGISTFREGRRRASLNEAMHELRRPLQVLALSLPADRAGEEACDSSLRMATAALERLDREINGGPAEDGLEPVEMKALAEAAVRRWKSVAALRGRGLRLLWRAGDPIVAGSEIDFAQALDNLINNALEHGGGKVTIEVREAGGRLRVAVRNLNGLSLARGERRERRDWARRIGGRQRHGHGLRVVARTAADHGGSFRLLQSKHSTEARLELPLRGEGESR
ncbi:MAG: sensor histidine kinase [Solirubrobacterales bacterium]